MLHENIVKMLTVSFIILIKKLEKYKYKRGKNLCIQNKDNINIF